MADLCATWHFIWFHLPALPEVILSIDLGVSPEPQTDPTKPNLRHTNKRPLILSSKPLFLRGMGEEMRMA